MSSSTNTDSTHEASDSSECCLGRHFKGRANWSPINIAGMVIGFVLFWPLGLFMLYWILSGRNVRDLPAAIQQKWASKGRCGGRVMHSDNVVFNEYQQTQYDRISEIKEEIRKQAHRFHTFRADAKRRADEAEFNEFMAKGPQGNSN